MDSFITESLNNYSNIYYKPWEEEDVEVGSIVAVWEKTADKTSYKFIGHSLIVNSSVNFAYGGSNGCSIGIIIPGHLNCIYIDSNKLLDKEYKYQIRIVKDEHIYCLCGRCIA